MSTRTQYHRDYYQRTIERRRQLGRERSERERRARGQLPLSHKERYVRRVCGELGIHWTPPWQAKS